MGQMDTAARVRTPSSDIDLFAVSSLLDPYRDYAALRALGPAVWLTGARAWGVTHYDEARTVLRAADVFLSGYGTGLNDQFNGVLRATTQSSDGELHRQLRRTLQTPLMPTPLSALKEMFEAVARDVVAKIPYNAPFEAVTGLSQQLPLAIVSNLVGLPEKGREKMLHWAGACFESMGPESERTQAAFEGLGELVAYAQSVDDPSLLKPGSWGASLYEWAEQNGVPREKCLSMLLDYVVPSLDTTINATSAALYYLSRDPEQWAMLRADRGLIQRAIDEAVRLESPIRCFSRTAGADAVIGETQIRAGERVLVLYGAANRDERQWENPERFHLDRRNQAQVGFGHGEHVCVGMSLAKMEMTALLGAVADRFARLEYKGHRFGTNQYLRGLSELALVACAA